MQTLIYCQIAVNILFFYNRNYRLTKELLTLPSCRLYRLLVLVIAAVITGTVLVAPPIHANDDKQLTLDEALGFAGGIDQYGSIPRFRWLRSPKGSSNPPSLLETRFETNGSTLYQVNALNGTSVPLYDAKVLEDALAGLPGLTREAAQMASRNASAMRLDDSDQRAFLEIAGDIYAFDFKTKRATRVTESAPPLRLNTTFSPDGSHIAFTSNNDLYIATIHWDTGKPTPLWRVTKDGSNRILNGHLDWIYEEEVYGRGNTMGYRWSPNGKRLAFLRLDDTLVPTIPIIDHLARVTAVDEQSYPQAGDPNPKASMGIVNVGSENSEVVWTNLDHYPENDRLIVRYSFTPDSTRMLVQVQNRIQTFLHLLAANPATGQTVKLLEETTPAWTDMLDDPAFLSDGSFLWRSGRTGFRHIYRYDRDGSLLGAVTRGDWDVLEMLAIDEKKYALYFSSNKDSAVTKKVFQTRIDGVNNDQPVRITQREGVHDVDFDPTGMYYLDRWSDLDNPTQIRLHLAATGKEIRPLGANLLPITTRRGYKLSKPELLTIKARDGYSLDALILKPPDFNPTKKYRAVYFLYGGPESPTVQNRWGTISLWHQYLAEQGCIVFMCDNRSASGKGLRNAWGIYKNLGVSETRDIEDAVGYLKTLPYVDTSRLGVYGWSFGGFLVEYLLTHTTLFKVGVAGGAVSDWRLYDSIGTERYMDTPFVNASGYRESAPINAASKLSGKLLLLHGTLDDNVHLQNTMQFSYALERADKTFDMMLYPRSRHTISDPALSRHMRTLLTKYLLDNL